MAYEKNIEKDIALGKNTLGAEEAYIEKKFYYDEVYPNGKTPWPDRPLDFVNENPLYGKVDLNKNFIYPKTSIDTRTLYGREITTEYMVPLKTGEETHKKLRAFNFVADAFAELRAYIKGYLKNGYIQPDKIVSECEPKKAFVDVRKTWEAHKDAHYASFSAVYLSLTSDENPLRQLPIKEKVENISHFIKYYKEFVKTKASTIPLTMSGVISKTIVSPLSTGLCIEIHDEAYDNDEAKQEFIESPNFNFFKCAARLHGFMLDRNVPWRLIADVTSYKMREYMRITFERPQIEAARAETLDAKQNELNTMRPYATPLQDILNRTVESPLDKWNQNKIANFQNEIQEEMESVRATVTQNNSAMWEMKSLKNASDAESTPDGKPNCNGSICQSRIMKLSFFFQEYYHRAYLEDIWHMRRMIWGFWKSWITANPMVKKIRTKGCLDAGFKTMVVEEKEVEDINWQKYKLQFDKKFWLKFYFDVRSQENKIMWPTPEYRKKLKRVNFLNKMVDFNRATGYINSMTKDKMLEAQNIYISRPEPEDLPLDWV